MQPNQYNHVEDGFGRNHAADLSKKDEGTL